MTYAHGLHWADPQVQKKKCKTLDKIKSVARMGLEREGIVRSATWVRENFGKS